MPSPVEGITTLELPVAQLARAVAWYEHHLGLRCTWRGEHEAALAAAQRGAVALYLVQTDAPERLTFRNSRHGYRQSVVDFATGDLPDLHARLKDGGVDVDDLAPN